MYVYKCDLCKKVIKEGAKKVSVGYGSRGWAANEFCDDCGKPVVAFLQKHDFVEKKEIEHSQKRQRKVA